MANKPEKEKEKKRKKKKKEKKERTHGGKEEEKREKQTKNTFSTNKQNEKARNVSEQRDKCWIHVIRVHNAIHSADNNTGGQHTRTNYPTQRKNERFVKHRDYPPHVNERYNSRNKRTSREKTTTTVNGKNRQLAQPGQTLTQGGHEIASLLN